MTRGASWRRATERAGAQTLGETRLGGAFGDETVHADLRGRRSYHDFLELDKILDAQPTVTGEHDEPLFFILHQVKELWMKLMLHELEAAFPPIRNDDLRPAFKIFARVKRIQENLIQAWHILTTMTPADYLKFRDGLGRSSGFQSFQYRSIEFVFGNKQRETMAPVRAPARHRPAPHRSSWSGRASTTRPSCCSPGAATPSTRRCWTATGR